MPTTYVARSDYREDNREIKEMLAKIFDKLEAKVDK
jgi:ribosomal protein L30/L7E